MSRNCAVRAALISVTLVIGVEQRSSLATEIKRSAATDASIEYPFTPDDEALLDEIQYGCFKFLWDQVGSPVPLVKDRLTDDVVSSLAGVGFQLSSLPIGIQRGWITQSEGEQRAEQILQALVQRQDNKKFGIYLHYVDLNHGGLHSSRGAQVQASTVDHALLQAGAMTAGVYFGGEVESLANQMVRQANWKTYEVPLNEGARRSKDDAVEKFISFGWRAEREYEGLAGPGDFRPWSWYKASDEELLVTFLAVGSPTAEHRVEPEMYYRLHRTIKQHRQMSPHVVSWGGQAFTYFFAHCWIDYRGYGADDPQTFGVDQPPVDWFENSRRALLTHRQRCIESAEDFRSFGPNRWGMSPCADINSKGDISYIVQSVRPCMEDRDNFFGGTVAPYAAGSSIMFTPEESIAALRDFRHLKDDAGNLIVWRDTEEGGYGLLDSYNLDRTDRKGTPDYLSIDHGPMLLAIENARTGLIWKLFMQHPSTRAAIERLKFRPLD
ncbi:MAG: glucoamylase family protein [Planctomycetota bacterium]